MFEKQPQKPSPARMLRLLRRRGSDDYFSGHGWTAHIEQAQCFHDSLEAAKVCVAWSLTDVELVLRFQDASGDVFAAEMG